jgi:hypothetical protein
MSLEIWREKGRQERHAPLSECDSPHTRLLAAKRSGDIENKFGDLT